MRICVFGAGALGSAIGGILARRNEVVLIARTPHVRAIRRAGLLLTGDVRRRVRLAAFPNVSRLDPPELLLITTKAYDTQQAIIECRGWASDETAVLTLQNGLGNFEALEKWKKGLALGGTTTLGSTMMSPGRVRVSGLGHTFIGSRADASMAKTVVRCFAESGIPTEFNAGIDSEIWAKAIISSCINPLTAILRVPNGRLLESRAISRMLKEISLECERVAEAKGVKLPQSHMYPRVRAVANDTSENLSSMLQDVLRGRRTEIEQLNGAFWRLSEELGLDLPLNTTLTSMIQSMRVTHSRNVNIRS